MGYDLKNNRNGISYSYWTEQREQGYHSPPNKNGRAQYSSQFYPTNEQKNISLIKKVETLGEAIFGEEKTR